MAEGNNIPSLRFSGFSGEWEKKEITAVARVFIGLVTTMTTFYRKSGVLLIRNSDIKNNFFNFADTPIFLDENFALDNASRKLQIGDVVTVHTGDVGASAVITEKENGAIGFATINTRPDRRLVDSKYLSVYFNSEPHKSYAMLRSTGDGRANYNLSDFLQLELPITEIKEQAKIGTFFQNLDNQITLKQRKLDKLVTLKKAMLEKMFPKEGQDKPEIRFKGFSGTWKVSTYKDIFTKLTSNSLSRADLNYENGCVKNVHYGDVLIKFSEVLDVQKNVLPYISDTNIFEKYKSSKLENGDIIIADAAEDEAVGKCTELAGLTAGDNIIAGLHTIAIRPRVNFASGYLGYFLNHSIFHNQLLQLAQGTKVLSISHNSIQETQIQSPRTIEEQSSIACYFGKLDELISLQKTELTKLKQIKSSCLEKMFI